MDAGYPVISAPCERELVVKASRFIAALSPAAEVREAKAFIDGKKAQYPDASHNCWAYLVGPPGSTRDVGASDDGEPHGSAGKPMLNVLLHADVGDVVVVVTRYFGGIKLGRGGMARAYARAVQDALDGAPRAVKVDWFELEVRCDYAVSEAIDRALPEHRAEILDQAFGALVSKRVRVPRGAATRLAESVRDLSRGAALLSPDPLSPDPASAEKS